MPGATDLATVFRDTDYRVRLAGGGHASIRIGRPLPPALRPLVAADTHWAFVTAWNPRARYRPRAANRTAQRALLEALRAAPGTERILAGIGIGRDWREPGLFAIGTPLAVLDALLRRFDQVAMVVGVGHDNAGLHWNDAIAP